MADIRVPKPPKKAFNPNRPASDLLKFQIEHFEWAVRHAGQRKGGKIRVKPVRTEAEAAARISALLPKLASANELPFIYGVTPPEAVAPARRATTGTRRTRKATRRTTKSTRGKSKARRRKAKGRRR